MMLKKIWNVITALFVAMVVIIAAILLLLRLVGFNSYFILSASMSPTYKVGDLVYSKYQSFTDINIGDVIVFNTGNASVPVMHRVVDINQKNRTFITKGDANNTKDANPVNFKNVIGVVKLSIPKIGLVIMYFSSQNGKYIYIALVIVLLLFLMISKLLALNIVQKKEEKHE